jgi:CubicO group peptidase (beta-lactamase class C family)
MRRAFPVRRRLACPFLALVAACAGGEKRAEPIAAPVPVDVRSLPIVFPPAGGNWATISPAALGWDTTALATALDWAGTQQSTAVLIAWRGRLVAERYWRGWTPTTDSIIASAGKSVLATVVGQLVSDGRLALDAPVSAYLGSGWSRSPSTEARITVRHLLQMASGLNDSLQLVAQPGNRFYYNNPAYYQLFAVVTRTSGQDITTTTRSRLLAPIGMGGTWRLNIDTGEPGFVFSCTARDMARFGLLQLANGRWDGARVVDSGWTQQMRRQGPPDNAAYGLLWWLNGSNGYRLPGPYLLPTQPGMLIPSAPADLAAALGKGDKKIYVVPSLDLVVVRHGAEADVGAGNPLALSTFDEQLWQRLRAAIRY